MRHLLQVCNVGRIVGGTAACAWTVTRALPDWRHTVAFLSDFASETQAAFSHCVLLRWDRVTNAAVEYVGPDVVLLHNTPAACCERLRFPTVQYLHSRNSPASADMTIACSRWLANQMRLPAESVVHQAVPRPLRQTVGRIVNPPVPPTSAASLTLLGGESQMPIDPRGKSIAIRTGGLTIHPTDYVDRRAVRTHPVIGRLCTPSRKKWPADVVPFYAKLAAQFPRIEWEFVGCSGGLKSRLTRACGGNAAFIPASWQARSRLWHWDALLYHNPHVTESFGRTVAEAMRAGCLPIVDAHGGFTEQVAERCGFLCDDIADFTAAAAAIQSPAARFAMSHRCREHANEWFSLAGFRERLVVVFGRAAEAFTPRRRTA